LFLLSFPFFRSQPKASSCSQTEGLIQNGRHATTGHGQTIFFSDDKTSRGKRSWQTMLQERCVSRAYQNITSLHGAAIQHDESRVQMLFSVVLSRVFCFFPSERECCQGCIDFLYKGMSFLDWNTAMFSSSFALTPKQFFFMIPHSDIFCQFILQYYRFTAVFSPIESKGQASKYHCRKIV
jgi:hypothetical protein